LKYRNPNKVPLGKRSSSSTIDTPSPPPQVPINPYVQRKAHNRSQNSFGARPFHSASMHPQRALAHASMSAGRGFDARMRRQAPRGAFGSNAVVFNRRRASLDEYQIRRRQQLQQRQQPQHDDDFSFRFEMQPRQSPSNAQTTNSKSNNSNDLALNDNNNNNNNAENTNHKTESIENENENDSAPESGLNLIFSNLFFFNKKIIIIILFCFSGELESGELSDLDLDLNDKPQPIITKPNNDQNEDFIDDFATNFETMINQKQEVEEFDQKKMFQDFLKTKQNNKNNDIEQTIEQHLSDHDDEESTIKQEMLVDSPQPTE